MKVIAIDFIVGLPKAFLRNAMAVGKLRRVRYYDDGFLQVIETLTTPTWPFNVPEQIRGTVLLRQLMLSNWGVPHAIISNRDRKFTSELWKGLWKALGAVADNRLPSSGRWARRAQESDGGNRNPMPLLHQTRVKLARHYTLVAVEPE